MRKLIFLLLAACLIGQAKGQTKVDSLLFGMINDYRVSHGISKLVWDTNIYKAAKHHSEYLSSINFVYKEDSLKLGHFIGTEISPHLEQIKIDSIEDVNTLWDRFKRFAKGYDYYSASENVVFGGYTIKNMPKNDVLIAQSIFNSWLHSSKHKKNMMDKESDRAACSIIFKQQNNVYIYKNGKTIKFKNNMYGATLDLYQKL